MVAVFKTNVPDRNAAQSLLHSIKEQWPQCKVNFDLQDCDRILRVEGEQVNEQAVMAMVQASGFHCSPLEERLSMPLLTW